MVWVGFARTYLLGFGVEFGAVCGGEEMVVDRWYYHLLVLHLVFLLLLVCIILFSNRALLVLALVSPCACDPHIFTHAHLTVATSCQ